MVYKNIKKFGLIISVVALSIANSFSQNTFRISYDVDPLYDMPGGIVESTTGNYVFGGGLLIGGITEIDPTGVVNWSEGYSEGSTIFSDVLNVGTGYLVAGSSSNRLLLMETSSTGIMTWGKKYNTSADSESAAQVKRLGNGDYIIAGSVTGYDPDGSTGPLPKHDSSTLYIVKTNSVGTVLWDKIILPTAFDNDHYLTDVAEVSGGYVFVGSVSEGVANDNIDAIILKTDVNGNILWTKTLGSAGVDDAFESINPLSNGQLLISGFIDEDLLMLRVDANGADTWSWTYDDPDLIKLDITQGFNAFETNDGNYACVGTYIDVVTFVNGVNGNFPMIGTFLIKVSPSSGNIIFQKFYQNGLSSLMPDGIQTSDNGYLLTMMAQEIAPLSGFNYHVIKTDPNGDVGANCDLATINLTNSGFTSSFTTITPSAYSGTSESVFTPITNTPTPAIGAICCSVDDPTTASASPTTVCAGQSITITASGSSPGVTYNIYDANTGGNLVGTAGTPFVPTQGTYYVEAANSIGCTSLNRISVSVTIVAIPTVTATATPATICAGETSALAASGATTYSWSPTTNLSASTGANVTFTSTTAGTNTFTVTGTTSGCSSTGTVTVTVNAPPAAVISGPATACDNEMITLDASSSTADSYVWNNGATTSSITVLAGTGYTVDVGITGCTATDQATHPITIDASPTASIVGGDVCSGSSVTLTASGGSTYVWLAGGSTGATLNVSPTVATTYDVEATASNGCKDTAQFTVNVNALPTITVGGTTTVCDGDNTLLTASGASTYAWSPATDLSAITGTSVTSTPTGNITYIVTGTDANSCVNSTTVSLTVNALPSVGANVSPSSTVCTGSSVTLTGSGATSYIWDNTVVDGASFTPAVGSVLYTVTGTDGNNCSNTDTITVNVVAPPVAAINGSANGTVTACSNETTTLTITPAGGTYLWSTGETTQTINVMPGSTTTYNATVTIGSCSDATSITITVNTAPTGAVGGTGNNLVCTGTNDTLTASGGSTYLWNTTETTPSIVVTPVATTIYSVVVYDANLCTDTLTYSVSVNPLPTISITGIDTICSGTSTTLAGNGGISYIWSTAETTQSISVSPTLNANYTVTGTDANGCQNTDQVSIVVMSPPSAAITGNTTTCTGQAVVLTAAGGNNYVWSTGETTGQVSVSPGTTTTYTVIAYVGTCTDTATYTVNVTSPPNVIVGADTSIIIGQSFTLNASGATEYSWITPNDGIDASELNTSNPTASPEETITYCVVGEQFGCVDTACINVEVRIDCGDIFVPNAFSPNGDNNNDCLKVYSNCLETMTLRIFARWGEMVYEATDIEACWDGTYKGQALNTATFAFVLEYTLIDGTSDVLKGNVSLIK